MSATQDERNREPKDNEYHLEWKRDGETVGLVVCVRPRVQMVDFYRTTTVLACDTVEVKGES